MSEESDNQKFPVLWQGGRKLMQRLTDLKCPRSVPFAFVDRYRDACLRNHSQTPERLAERGGLSPQELIAITCDEQNWDSRKKIWHMPEEDAVPLLKRKLVQFEEETKP